MQSYNLSPALLGVIVSNALLDTVIGVMTAGNPGQRFGRRDSLRVMAISYIVSALGCAFAWNWPTLIFFPIIGGFGIAGSSVLGPMLIAEIGPPEWRGHLVGLFQINIVVGISLVYVSNALIGGVQLGATEWRWQLGISTVAATLFLRMRFGILRSPRWLVSQSKLDEALDLLRLTGIPQRKKNSARLLPLFVWESCIGGPIILPTVQILRFFLRLPLACSRS